ncbi:type III secretion protein [Pseudomonas sp. AMR01]|uniref:type III secretion protein n=1 Tax=Pseudomonas sp. AMR01 TaxID=3064904 RepID=UPI0035BEED63
MTATSFQSCQSNGRDAFRSGRDADLPASLKDQGVSQNEFSAALLHAYGEEAQRLNAFAGQHKFQAPVADDFARGMLAPGQSGHADDEPLKQPEGTWAALIKGLVNWWRGQKPG